MPDGELDHDNQSVCSDRRADPSLMDENDITRLLKAEEKRKRRKRT